MVGHCAHERTLFLFLVFGLKNWTWKGILDSQISDFMTRFKKFFSSRSDWEKKISCDNSNSKFSLEQNFFSCQDFLFIVMMSKKNFSFVNPTLVQIQKEDISLFFFSPSWPFSPLNKTGDHKIQSSVEFSWLWSCPKTSLKHLLPWPLEFLPDKKVSTNKGSLCFVFPLYKRIGHKSGMEKGNKTYMFFFVPERAHFLYCHKVWCWTENPLNVGTDVHVLFVYAASTI